MQWGKSLFAQRVYICSGLNEHLYLVNIPVIAGEIEWTIAKGANLIDISQRVAKSWVIV